MSLAERIALVNEKIAAAARQAGREPSEVTLVAATKVQTSGTIRANAYLRHRGRSTCLVSVDIVGEGGNLLATGEFTFFCVDKNILDEKAGKKD